MNEENLKDKDIFGAALLDYLDGNYTEDITVISSLTEDDEIPIPYLFREFEDMPTLEQKALEISTGKVLDVGCGAGSHSIYLHKKGLSITGIDTSAGAIDVCKKRLIKSAFCTNLLDFSAEKYGKFDTILLLMNGSGIFESLSKIDTYLKHLKTLLNTDGQILLDSSDIAYMYDEEDGSYWRDATRDYYGEVTFSISYKNEISKPFDWLYIDFETLAAAAEKNGLRCELVLEGEHYDYLSRLTFL
ncbi:MAG: methyltransferase domain-containing protein [Leeuwenhoekiella sp.]